MPTGTVKFFNAAKGFGFITPDDGSKDVFVPAASIAASGIAALKQGWRVGFETQPDAKGPKAVELKVIAETAPPEPPPREAPREQARDAAPSKAPPGKPRITVYLDPTSDLANDAVAEIREAGFEPLVIDYITNPPTSDQLKTLSLLLREGDQSLVRKYEPMFVELRLDDRFISDTDFWTAVHEHPFLINGPILATASKVSVCRTEASVEAFLAIITGEAPPVSKPKGLPDSLLRLARGEVAAAPMAHATIAEPQAMAAEFQTAMVESAVVAAPAKIKLGPRSDGTLKARTSPAPKEAVEVAVATKPKPARVAAKPAAKKVIKKPGRAKP